MNSRGEQAREEILNRAIEIASVEGLEGLSLGVLAKDLGRSKSGLFAHFANKEALQLEVLETASQKLTDQVLRPSLKQPRGAARLKALMSNWGRWAREESRMPGGCVFVSASVELDDKPGPVRDRLVEIQRAWLDSMRRVIETGVAEGDFRADLDPEQMAFEVYSVMLGSHHYYRLLGDEAVVKRVKTSFARILADASATPDS
jgi:AcrR family transcriptional regulator